MRSIVFSVSVCLLVSLTRVATAQPVRPAPGSGAKAPTPAPASVPETCPISQEDYDKVVAERDGTKGDLTALLNSGECSGATTDRLKGTVTPPADKPPATTPKYKYMEEWRDVPKGHKVCENGGKVLVKGRDKNKNRQLDDKEITDREYACNGADGTPGAPGTPGTNGQDGLSTDFEEIPAGDECADGGLRVMKGLDVDHDGALKGDEITKSVTRCIDNGTDGEDAAPVTPGKGIDGKNGRNGLDGTSVALGLVYSADYVTSATEPRTLSSGAGLDFQVQRGRWRASLAALWSPGADRGGILRTNLTYFPWERVGFTGGAKLIYAGMNEQDEANSRFVLGEVGATFRFLDSGHWKGQIEAHVGYGGAGVELAPTTSAGASTSLVWQF